MEDNKKNPFHDEEQVSENEALQDETSSEDIEDNSEELNNDEAEEKIDDSFEQKYEDLNNKYIRLAADFDNFRKRTENEKKDLLKYGASEVLTKIIAVLDTFDRAKESLEKIDNCETVKQSYDVAIKQLHDTLQKVGMVEIEAIGKEFDPNEHEAVTRVPSDEVEEDHIVFVAQKGYKLIDKVLRPALVGVAKKKENE